MSILLLQRLATSLPEPGNPRASTTAPTVGTPMSLCIVITPQTECLFAICNIFATSNTSTGNAISANCIPGASKSQSTAIVLKPSFCAADIAGSWPNPAPIIKKFLSFIATLILYKITRKLFKIAINRIQRIHVFFAPFLKISVDF